jgi:hypothetical protein
VAELDFAMLAEFARVDPSGLLTIVNGAFDQIEMPGPGLVQRMALAFRIELEPNETSASFEVKITQPDEGAALLGLSGTSVPNTEGKTPVGKLGVITAVDMGFPVMKPGRYVIQVFVEGELAKQLPFDVRFQTPPAG